MVKKNNSEMFTKHFLVSGLPPKKEKVPTAEPVPVAAPLTAPLLAPVGVPEPVPAPVPNVYNPKPVEKPKIEPFTIGIHLSYFCNIKKITQLLSGRVLDSRPRGCGLEPQPLHCVVVLEQDTFILA